MERKQTVPFYEIMTRFVFSRGLFNPNLTVRVWTASEEPYMGPDTLVVERLSDITEAVEDVQEVETAVKIIHETLMETDSVAAFEILDSNGNGYVTYTQWCCDVTGASDAPTSK